MATAACSFAVAALRETVIYYNILVATAAKAKRAS